MIIKVTGKSILVKRFDDFTVKEIDLRYAISTPNTDNEMRSCKRAEVEKYIESHKADLRSEAVTAKKEHVQTQTVHLAYLRNAKKAFAR